MLWSLSLEKETFALKEMQSLKYKNKNSSTWCYNGKRGNQSCAAAGSPLLCSSGICRQWDRVRWQLALAGVWVVQLAWLGWGICGAETEKPRLATRGHIRQPCLCFYAWPHSTWRWKRAMEAEDEEAAGEKVGHWRCSKVSKLGTPVKICVCV